MFDKETGKVNSEMTVTINELQCSSVSFIDIELESREKESTALTQDNVQETVGAFGGQQDKRVYRRHFERFKDPSSKDYIPPRNCLRSRASMAYALSSGFTTVEDVPKTVQEALSRQDADKWQEAMKDEL